GRSVRTSGGMMGARRRGRDGRRCSSRRGRFGRQVLKEARRMPHSLKDSTPRVSNVQLLALPADPATTSVEPEGLFVAGARAGLTPAQLVDRKLLALLRSGNPGLFLQATGRPEDVRRIPGGPHTPPSASGPPGAAPEWKRRRGPPPGPS